MEYITQEGFKETKQHLEWLDKEIQRTQAMVKEAVKFGDLRENSEYLNYRTLLKMLEDERDKFIKDIHDIKIYEFDLKSKRVQIGSIVNISSNNERMSISIVGKLESDYSCGKIYYKTPLGQELLDKEVTDLIEFKNKKWRIETIERM